jgi:hypothetical protein
MLYRDFSPDTPRSNAVVAAIACALKRFARTMSRRNGGPTHPVQLRADENFSRRLQPSAYPSHLKDKRAMNGTKEKRS